MKELLPILLVLLSTKVLVNHADQHGMGHAMHATTHHPAMDDDQAMHNATDADHAMHNGSDHDHGMHEKNGTDHTMHGGGGAHHSQVFFFLPDVTQQYVILFEEWVTHSAATFIGSCVGVAVLAVLYEGLKLLREVLKHKERRTRYRSKRSCSCSCTCLHLLQTLLHMVQVFISYCLMMVFMLFNAWLCLAVILGAGAGYCLFGLKKRSLDDGEEHCH